MLRVIVYIMINAKPPTDHFRRHTSSTLINLTQIAHMYIGSLVSYYNGILYGPAAVLATRMFQASKVDSTRHGCYTLLSPPRSVYQRNGKSETSR